MSSLNIMPKARESALSAPPKHGEQGRSAAKGATATGLASELLSRLSSFEEVHLQRAGDETLGEVRELRALAARLRERLYTTKASL